MAKIDRIAHAEHNQKACNFLMQEPDYADWVIITAFYSSIHFVDHRIFPIKVVTEDGQKFTVKNIDEYRNTFGITKDKHSVRGDLVRERCAKVQFKFEWLKSACWTARYTNFLIKNPDESIDRAKKYLDEISKFCNPPKTEEVQAK